VVLQHVEPIEAGDNRWFPMVLTPDGEPGGTWGALDQALGV
jgi:hypothetical protein